MSARKKIYDHIHSGGIKKYKGQDLMQIANVQDWQRPIRQLQQDGIISYTYDHATNSYNVAEINTYSNTTKRSGISSKDKYRISNRDGHRCQACGNGVNDGVKIHIDHKIPLDWGGTNNDDNLWALCGPCNQAKKSFYKDDFDANVMKLVFKEKSGMAKLKVLFLNSPNIKFSPSILQGIAGIRDWTRTLRTLRSKDDIKITWVRPSVEYPNGYYVNDQ